MEEDKNSSRNASRLGDFYTKSMSARLRKIESSDIPMNSSSAKPGPPRKAFEEAYLNDGKLSGLTREATLRDIHEENLTDGVKNHHFKRINDNSLKHSAKPKEDALNGNFSRNISTKEAVLEDFSDNCSQNFDAVRSFSDISSRNLFPYVSNAGHSSALSQQLDRSERRSERGDELIIPELPSGRTLILDIKTTWGDIHYVGLNGIEMFNSAGQQIQVETITAEPADINVLPQYCRDPRVVQNLIDGVNLTRDDAHVWLAPFTPNARHTVTIKWCNVESLAMLRIWNYNKSRVHVTRGVREVSVMLDHALIFAGEIARASGQIQSGMASLSDTILFTTDGIILEKVAENDEYFNIKTDALPSPVDATAVVSLDRPPTADTSQSTERPWTCARRRRKHSRRTRRRVNVPDTLTTNIEKPDDVRYIPSVCEDSKYLGLSYPRGYMLTIQIHSTWGDPYYVGLNGIALHDENCQHIYIDKNNISAFPESINVLNDELHDARTPDKLVDGVNDTLDGRHMWLAPVLPLTINRVDIIFPAAVQLSSMHLWNYAKTPARGVREFGVMMDGLLIYNGELPQYVTGRFSSSRKITFTPDNYLDPVARSQSHRTRNDKEFLRETSSGVPYPDPAQRPFTTMRVTSFTR